MWNVSLIEIRILVVPSGETFRASANDANFKLTPSGQKTSPDRNSLICLINRNQTCTFKISICTICMSFCTNWSQPLSIRSEFSLFGEGVGVDSHRIDLGF